MIDLIKSLLGISDTSKDAVLQFYIDKAQNAIKKYCKIDDLTGLDNQIVELAIFYYKNKNDTGITSQSQGSRSKSVVDGIPQSIKDTLPLPKIKVVG